MTHDTVLNVSLPPDLTAALRQAASAHGWTPEELIRDCVAQTLEIAVRHRVVMERMQLIDTAILAIAQVVGELSAPAASIDLSQICRYCAKSDNGSGSRDTSQ